MAAAKPLPTIRPLIHREKGVVLIDLETTGLPGQSWAYPIEIGMVRLDPQGREVKGAGILVNPPILDWHADAIQHVHGISRAEIAANGTPWWDVRDFFMSAYESWGRPPVTSYNWPFERWMLGRIGIQNLVEAGCAAQQARILTGHCGGGFPSLKSARRNFGLSVAPDAHRALPDTRALAELVVAMDAHVRRDVGLPEDAPEVTERAAETRIVNVSAKFPDAIYIGRPGNGSDGPFGNPFPLTDEMVWANPRARTECLNQYREYLERRMANDPPFRDSVMALQGKRLSCFCPPPGRVLTRNDLPWVCHGQVMATVIKQFSVPF